MASETVKIKVQSGDDFAAEKESEPEINWQIEEPDHLPKNAEWFWALGILALSLIVFSILLKNYLLIIIIALAAFVIYARKNKRRELVDFRLDNKGLHIDSKFYSYEDFESFWIFPDKEIAFRNKRRLLPLLIAPFNGDDESAIKKILSDYLPESEEEESFLDLLRKRFF